MEFKYILTEGEMISAMKLHGKGSKFARVALIFLGIALILTAILTSHKLLPLLVLTSGIAGYLVPYFILIPYQAKKQYKELKSIQSEITMIIESDGIKIETTIGNNNLDWSHFKKWNSNEHIIIIYITSKMFYMLPQRVFSSESERESVINTLNENIRKAT